jgi:trimethylamine--corrinoid protein Co-methyltransferase
LNRLPLYEPLSADEVSAVDDAALRVLEQVGVDVGNSTAAAIYRRAGARVDGTRVRLPRALVDEYVALAPQQVTLCGRDPKHDLRLFDTQVHVGTGGAALDVIDLYTGQRRPAALRDIAQIALLVDNLQNIHFYLRPCEPRDIPLPLADVNKYFAAITHTTKHVIGSVNSLQGLAEVVDLAGLVAGGEDEYRSRPFLSFICCWMISPLRLDTLTTELMLEVVRRRLPVVLSTAPMAGATAPYTLAGALVQTHAELLSGITLAQIASPGAPVIYGAVPSAANMRDGGYCCGAIEFGMLNAAVTQVARARRLPIYNSAGLTESKVPDIQAGYEKAFSVLQTVLAAGNFIHHSAGMLESMRTISYVQYVIDDEILGMALRAARGIEVNEETLGVESILRTGPGGNYLTDDLTLKYLRSERFLRAISDERSRHNDSDDSVDLFEVARRRAIQILETAAPPGLPNGVEEAIRRRFDIRL